MTDIADHFVFYLERDVLGKLSNMWLALCDSKGQNGPKDNDCMILSHYLSISVDFAKHGECVSKDEVYEIQKLVGKYPKWLGNPRLNYKESNGVIGNLYEKVLTEDALNSFIGFEW